MLFSELAYYACRIVRWKLGDRTPLIASIKLTYRCNLRCLHCPWKDLEKRSELSFDTWKLKIKSLHELGVRFIFFEGGETTLYPHLKELIEYSKGLGIKTIVNTNGTHSLEDYAPHSLIISIDGPEDIHDQIRGKGTFKKVIHNIKDIQVKKIALMTLSKINFQHIHAMISAVDEYVDAFGFTVVYPIHGSHGIELSRQEMRRAYDEILSQKDKFDVFNSSASLTAESWKCSPWFVKVLEPDGNINNSATCLVEIAKETQDCSLCHVGCYKEASQILRGNLNAWYMWYKFFIC